MEHNKRVEIMSDDDKEIPNFDCPICGGLTEIKEGALTLSAPFGPPRTIKTHLSSCLKCKETVRCEYDDEFIEKALLESEMLASQKILEEFQRHGITIPSLLCTLRMPMDLINKWKNNEFSSEASALLRCLKVSVLYSPIYSTEAILNRLKFIDNSFKESESKRSD